MDTFVWVGAGLTVAGLFLLVQTWLFLRGAASTQGRVVGQNAYSGERGMVYSPVVEYTSPSGGVHRVTTSIRSGRPRVLGEVVPVKYDPNRPERGRLATPLHLWGLGGFLFLMGLSSLGAALAVA